MLNSNNFDDSEAIAQRKWFRSIIMESLIEHNAYSKNISAKIDNILGLKSNIIEEIFSETKINNESVFPSLEMGEKELLELEMKMAKIQIILIFIPILYITLSLLSSIGVINQLWLLLNIIILINQFNSSQLRSYELDGWTKLLNVIKGSYNNLLISPYRELHKFNEFIENTYSIELGDEFRSKKKFGPYLAIQVLYYIFTNFNNLIHSHVLSEFIRNTKSMPLLEKSYKLKKTLFTKQFLIISIAISFFIVIMSSLTMIFGFLDQKYGSTLPINFVLFSNSSASLGILTIFLTSTIVYVFSKQFYVWPRIIIIPGLIFLISLFLYLVITNFFISILILN